MHTLKPYQHPQSVFSIEADLQFMNDELVIDFKLTDPGSIFLTPQDSAMWNSSLVERLDGLWHATCFEVFLKPEGVDKYYEFNFSLAPAWNAYQFETYRQPQPPVMSEDFVMQNMIWNSTHKTLKIRLENNCRYKNFHVGLTAILVEKNKTKHFCALEHVGSKPDFHLEQSFTLVRGVEK